MAMTPLVDRHSDGPESSSILLHRLVVLLIGLQVRYVSAYVLNPEATQFLAERTGQSTPASSIVFCRRTGNVRRAAESA